VVGAVDRRAGEIWRLTAVGCYGAAISGKLLSFPMLLSVVKLTCKEYGEEYEQKQYRPRSLFKKHISGVYALRDG